MVFRQVSSKVDLPGQEEEVLKFWEERQTFRQSIEWRKDAPPFVFYEGPPTANGRPGIHHVLGRVYKDTIARFHTMQGKRVLRKGGWDTHGLPVEIEVEKELGFTGQGKRAIEEYGVAEFNKLCRRSVLRYVEEWTRLSDRIAFWLDMDDPYITMSNDYIESVWWILKQIWNKDLIYQGYKVVPYCARCGTPLSSHEVALGYEEVEDPSIYVRFPLRDQPGTYLLVWTTTPWTLPGNVALAINPDITYALVQQGDDKLILAKDLLQDALRGEYTILREVQPRELVGAHYKPLFTFVPVDEDYCYVVAGDFVNTKEGTGIVHIAPAFGADDMEVGKEYGLPVLQTVNLEGRFIDEVTPWRGLWVKDADPLIVEELERRGLMYRVARYQHTYPFCWRCNTPLLYYAKTTWYVETTRVKDRLIANNDKINWYPAHIKEGRFGDWLQNNVDWGIGRDRYWGTPLPVWRCTGCGRQECIGSVAELREKAGAHQLPEPLDLHRPYIDAVTYRCAECGGTMQRVPEVIDCWFDSGAMPVAQWHYPFENRTRFADQFPADFICEAIDQTRGWFYSLHAISTLLFDAPCYRNVICYDLVLDERGAKMSKSRGNVVDPWEVVNLHGADAVRWYFYTASPPDLPRRFSAALVGDTVRKFTLTLWNTYAFFVTYANIDHFDPTAHTLPVAERSPLDRWVLAELHNLIRVVTDGLSSYDMTGPARRIQEFVDDVSNWYVRRSRRRFWKSEEDTDKVAAYLTLYEVLVTLSKLLAPFTPFLAEVLYQNLVREVNPAAPESVHLTDYPVSDRALVDEKLMAETRLAMRLVSLGHAARNQANIKVRQPLASALVVTRTPEERESLQRLADQMTAELNVKALGFVDEASELVSYEVSPKPREVGSKYKALYPKIKAAVAQMDAAEVARRMRAGETLAFQVDGQDVALAPEDVDIWSRPKEGYAVAEEGGYVVAVSTALTPELVAEGLAREVVRRIQTMRKDADLRIEEMITVHYEATPALARVMETWGGYIAAETLATALVRGAPPPNAVVQTHDVDGESITLGLVRQA